MAKNVVTLNLDNTDYSFRPYGTCSTGAATGAKTVSITGFTLCEGATILVKFAYANTAANPTLNVNGTGAKPIVMEGQRLPILLKDTYYEFLYDGSNWQLLTNTSILHKHYSILNIGETEVTPESKNWYTIGYVVDNNPCIYQISAYAHTDVVFSVTRGYRVADLTILNNTSNSNATCAYINGVRLVLVKDSPDILVQVRINHPQVNNSEYVDIAVTMIPTRMTSRTMLNDELIIDTTEYESSQILKSFDLNYTGSMYASNFIGALKGNVTGNVTGNVIGNVTGNVIGNVTGNVTGKTFESLLQWGNTNIAGDLSPLDTAMDGQWSSNRLSFMPASDIQVEYSTDSGSTWTDYGLTDSEKQKFVTTGLSHILYPGKNTTRQKINTDRVRVTITAGKDRTYFRLRKIYMYINQNGASGCKVLIEKSQCGSDTTFVQVGEYNISGRAGWNSIPLPVNFGGGDGQTANVRKLRFTYYFTTYATDYGEADDKLPVKWMISKLNMIGATSWTNSGGNLPTTGHIYSYDINQNVTFPANLTVKGNTALGDAASDTVTIACPATLNSNLTVKGNTTLGDAASDTVTVNSKTTLKNGLVLSSSDHNNTIQIANTDYPAATSKLFMGINGDFVIRSTFAADSSTSDLRWNKTSLKIGNEEVLTGTVATDAEITGLFD